MKSSSLAHAFGALICALALLIAPAVRAQAVFDVRLNTSALIGHPAGPFYLDFQLNDGTGLGNGNNTAVLSQFNFGSGGVLGGPASLGGVTGSLASTVTLTDSSAFNEFFQAFTPGTALGFRLTLTTNFNAPTPDLFSFAILDSDLFNIPTLSPGSDAFAIINLTGANPVVETYAGNSSIAPEAGGPPLGLPAPAFFPVPEPSTYGLMGAVALVGVIIWQRRRALPVRS